MHLRSAATCRLISIPPRASALKLDMRCNLSRRSNRRAGAGGQDLPYPPFHEFRVYLYRILTRYSYHDMKTLLMLIYITRPYTCHCPTHHQSLNNAFAYYRDPLRQIHHHHLLVARRNRACNPLHRRIRHLRVVLLGIHLMVVLRPRNLLVVHFY
jgi:hypothetical protein